MISTQLIPTILDLEAFAKLSTPRCSDCMLAACKVTCATTLYREGFSDQLIKEQTGHRSLEALHQYKRTGSQQQQDLSMALGPSISGMKPNFDKENVKPKCDSDDDDFVPLKKKAKL